MTRHLPVRMAIAVVALASAYLAAAQTPDLEGSKDPPLLPRVPGSWITGYDMKQLDEYELPLGPAAGERFSRSERVRGKVTTVTYQVPPDRSVLEAGEIYGRELDGAGFKTLFSCADEECGRDWGLVDDIRHFGWSFVYGQRQISAVLRRGGGDVLASIHAQAKNPNSVWVVVTVIETTQPFAGAAGLGEKPARPALLAEMRVQVTFESQGPAGPRGTAGEVMRIRVDAFDARMSSKEVKGRVTFDGTDRGPVPARIEFPLVRGQDGRAVLPTGSVTAPGYRDASFTVPLKPMSVRAEMRSLRNTPGDYESYADILVRAEEDRGGSLRPVRGRVLLDGSDAGATEQVISVTLRRQTDGRMPLPVGLVAAAGFQDTAFAFPLKALSARAELRSLRPEPGGSGSIAEIVVYAGEVEARGTRPVRARVFVGGVEVGPSEQLLRVPIPTPAAGESTVAEGFAVARGYADAPFTVTRAPTMRP